MEQQNSRKPQNRRSNRVILRRSLFLMIMFGVVTFGTLLVKLWQIQIIDHDFYEAKAIEQQTSDVTVTANRGTIYDAEGNVLAISATAYNVILSPRDILLVQKEFEKEFGDGTGENGRKAPTNDLIADGLAPILGVDRDKIMSRLQKVNSAYEVLASGVEEEVAAQVRQFVLDNLLSNGVFVTPGTKLYYPSASLASQVIGFVNSDNHGAYGIEAICDEELAGVNGRVITAKTGSGTEMLSSYENYMDAVDGNNLHLTIDSTIQYYAERTLADGIARFEAREGGFCIVMNPSTGAIYALASSPEYDLNNPRAISDPTKQAELDALKNTASQDDYLKALSDAQFDQWRNKALNDTYEPGSTFKTVVLASALEEGAVSEKDTFFCSGSVKVAGWTINCHKHTGHGSQTLRQAVMNSCNPAFIAIGQKLGAQKFYQYFTDFGLTDTTGIELPEGSNKNLVWSRDYFTSEEGIASLATASFGQRFNVTPIQLITAASAAVNGGHLMEPYVVSSVTDKAGNTVSSHEVTEVRQVISEQTSSLVRSMLESVVGDGGTGKNAYVAGYRIGGKTGTSQTLEDDHLIVSFLGFAPADDPQVIVLLAYDSPTPSSPGSNYTRAGDYISGGNMGAVMAGPLIADILDYLGVEKQYTQEELSGADTFVPKVTGLSAAEAQNILKESGLAWRVVGNGDTVTDQIPLEGASIPKNSQVVLYMGAEKPTELITVPNLSGRSPEQVRNILQEAGLYLRASGVVDYYSSSTVATSQSIESGAQVEPGTVIEVRFVDNQVRDF